MPISSIELQRTNQNEKKTKKKLASNKCVYSQYLLSQNKSPCPFTLNIFITTHRHGYKNFIAKLNHNTSHEFRFFFLILPSHQNCLQYIFLYITYINKTTGQQTLQLFLMYIINLFKVRTLRSCAYIYFSAQ